MLFILCLSFVILIYVIRTSHLEYKFILEIFESEILKFIITVWTIVQTVLTATFNSYGNRQISTPYKISIPEPIEQKIQHSWLRPRGDPLYQIWYKSTHRGLLGKWVKYYPKNFICGGLG